MSQSPPSETAQAELRLNSAVEIIALLREIQDRNLMLTLAAPQGGSYATTLLALEPDSHSLSFSADAQDSRVPALLQAQEVIAVAFLDSIRVQFQLDNLLLVNGPQGATLRADMPQEMFRFQRRNAYRVQPLGAGAPRATLNLAPPNDQELAPKLHLRVLDVSMGGLALLLPPGPVRYTAGDDLGSVQVMLDRLTQLSVRLRVQHVRELHAEPQGQVLGCAFEGLSLGATRELQRYIEQTQKRRRVLQAR